MDEYEPTTEELAAAIRVLVAQGVMAEYADEDTCLRNWEAVKEALIAANKQRGEVE